MYACVWGTHECVLRLMSGVVFCLSLPMYGGMVKRAHQCCLGELATCFSDPLLLP